MTRLDDLYDEELREEARGSFFDIRLGSRFGHLINFFSFSTKEKLAQEEARSMEVARATKDVSKRKANLATLALKRLEKALDTEEEDNVDEGRVYQLVQLVKR